MKSGYAFAADSRISHMWPFKKSKPTASELLLERFLQLESDRLSHRSDLEAKREELEVKKLEIELTHLEARTKAQIELETAQQELRLKKREAGRKGIQRRRELARQRVEQPTCPLCANPLRRDVTIEMVRQHAQHAEAEVWEAPDANRNGM